MHGIILRRTVCFANISFIRALTWNLEPGSFRGNPWDYLLELLVDVAEFHVQHSPRSLVIIDTEVFKVPEKSEISALASDEGT